MRLVYLHPDIRMESDYFWRPEFMNQCDKFLWVSRQTWQAKKVASFKPDHIHFASRAAPRKVWLPLNKLEALRTLLPKTVITTYRGGVGNEVSYLEKLNSLVDKAFGATDSYYKQEWMPAASNLKFWKVPRKGLPKYNIIFIGRCYTEYKRAERYNTLKSVQSRFKLTVVGNDTWKHFGINNLPKTTTFIQNRVYYSDALIGLNVVSEKYKKLSKYISNRINHMMLAGLPVFTYWQPNLDKVFKNHQEIVLYRSDGELLELLDFYIKVENRRKLERIGAAGQAVMVSRFTSNELVKRILSVKRKF